MSAPDWDRPGRWLKPHPGHNPLWAPAHCCCPQECAEIVLAMRCPVTDADGNQCGDYKGHRGKYHTLLVDSIFDIAAARLAERKDPS